MDEATASEDLAAVEAAITETLKTIFDPEIPVDIFELGLIYNVTLNEERHADVTMTLTSPACPVAGTLPEEVKTKVANTPGVKTAEVEVVWDPVWNPEMMTEAARLELGLL